MTVAELTKRIPLEPIVSCITHPPFLSHHSMHSDICNYYIIILLADHEEGPRAETLLYKNILLCQYIYVQGKQLWI